MAEIRRCLDKDFETIYAVINEAAQAYKGIIPPDRWQEPYMSKDELQQEIRDGVRFWAFEEDEEVLGVMGIQTMRDVSLIRHAYVRSANQKQGVGRRLLTHLMPETKRSVLVGTWASAAWAIRFYEKHGFTQVSKEEKDRLLTKYWSIPGRQIETSVVLVDEKWASSHGAHPRRVVDG